METMGLHMLWVFVRDYLAGKNADAQNATLARDLEWRGIADGDRIAKFTCPRCRHPLYFLEGFGPACSGLRGGCGLKAPRGKRAPFDK